MAGFDPSLDLQKAIGARLVASADLLALVPADSIRDVTGRPERAPAVIIGEGQTIYRRWDATVHTTLHVWFEEKGLEQAKAAAGAIAGALLVDAQMGGVLALDNVTVHDMRVTDSRFLRDPHGPFSHAVINVAAIVKAR
ncbi:DUF3168 domain-containing protein [Bradyrhizobium sp. WSM 1704]|uniref:DUF3168 domain-containing protein n=1 Tax=Bradyrhizobium semiaridum TaxID=2821404 RepID=UPI001CE3893E|nr:DUF3168 domain-containing protein [Bradyrhizobium semiaridum]MCA6124563.1 DUF3168 domain-containing protein [Bradyrhizobium semiaridum]